MVAISIIIPVYNAEKYIKTCLDSLLTQSFNNFEVIIVNDGSKDETFSICNTYKRKDNRINIINQSNAGVSAARLNGINQAKGEYILSIDSDDWIEPNMLELLYNTAKSEHSDFVVCDYDKIYQDHIETVQETLASWDNITYLKAQMGGGMWGTYWNKLIKRSLFTDYNIKPIIGITMWDDYVVTNRCAIYAKKISHCPHILYHYNQTNTNSLTKQHSEKNYLDIKKVIDIVLTEIHQNRMDRPLQKEIIKMKLVAKHYLLSSKYKDFAKWYQTYPEINNFAVEFTNDKNEKTIIRNILAQHYCRARLMQILFSYQEKIARRIFPINKNI